MLLAPFLLLAAPAGCKSGPDLSADYGQTARENYILALDEFADKDWEEAIAYADFVRIRFPFSRYAVEAELLIARAEFEQGNYVTARDAFKQFARLHPTHRHARNGWAAYMAAVSSYMNAPTNMFLLPKASERDQTPLHEALEDLENYFAHYAGTITEPYARKLRAKVHRRLLEHELYVARYYLDRDKPRAAIGRLEAAGKRYPDVGKTADILFLLGVTQLRIGQVETARATFSDLAARFPKHHHGKQARLYLEYIRKAHGPATPGKKDPPLEPPVPVSPPLPKNPDRPYRPAAASAGANTR